MSTTFECFLSCGHHRESSSSLLHNGHPPAIFSIVCWQLLHVPGKPGKPGRPGLLFNLTCLTEVKSILGCQELLGPPRHAQVRTFVEVS